MKVKICAIILILFAFSLYAQSDKDSRKVQLGDGSFVVPDKYPELTKHIKPVYPRQAILQDIQGKVFVKVTINEAGEVEGVKIAQGINSSLDKAAMAAAKKMEFSPAVYNGKRVKVSIAVPVNFILDPEKQGPKISMIGPPPQKVAELKDSKVDTVNISQDRKLIQKAGGEDPDPSIFFQVEQNPEPVQLVKPVYPDIARRAGLTGLVILRVLVSKEGKPIRVLVIKTDNEIFVEPAKKAAMETLFRPAMKGNEPINCWVNIPFRFSLNKDSEYGKSTFYAEIAPDGGIYYPKGMSDKYIEGQVILRVFYSPEGNIDSTEYIKSSNAIFDKQAFAFATGPMKPASITNGIKNKIGGKEVYAFTYTVTYRFMHDEKFAIYSGKRDYPEEAKVKKLSGYVEIEYVYDNEGRLLNTTFVKKTDSILDEAALKFFESNIAIVKSIKKYMPAGEKETRIQVVRGVEYKLDK